MHPPITELGLDGDPKLLHERRGTIFFKVGDTALKITDGLMAGREGQVLEALGADHYRAHGQYGEGTWLAMRWIDGTSLWDALEPAHRSNDTPATRRSILTAAAQAAEVLADLHAAGWTHGDLQPDHIVFEVDAVRIIDLACAQGPVPMPFYVHRGGRAHTTAPETVALILDTTEHIATTTGADVWSLAASLFWAWTRTPPTDYRDPQARRPDLLADIAAGRSHDIAALRPWPFPAFENALLAGLAHDPGLRPSAHSLARSLRAALTEAASVRE
ncbi:lipopolysaccharide kinase InaA family protein [Kitasatospora sp. NPDC059722]|uniref:protein kinase domain-containing protein n=1 Tax=Kitasatospora sp. NPDC059722 TaxID=3346925 RepID=UPI0036C0CF1E